MIGRQFKDEHCHFRACCSQDYRTLLAEKSSSPRSPRPSKLSLKVKPNQNKRLSSPSSILTPLTAGYQREPTLVEPASPMKPKVLFSWKNELVETMKKVGSATDLQQVRQLQLRQTKMLKLQQKILIESKYAGDFLSVGENNTQKEAKFEESFIMVDYFNPNSQQMSKIQNYLNADK